MTIDHRLLRCLIPLAPLRRGDKRVVKVPLLKEDLIPLAPLRRGDKRVVKVPLLKGDLIPLAPLRRGDKRVVKVPLLKGDLGGSELAELQRDLVLQPHR
jgi:hypothetical protein